MSQHSELTLIIFNCAGIAVATGLPILTLAHDFRVESTGADGKGKKHVSRWGVLAAFGIIVSAAIALRSEYLSQIRERDIDRNDIVQSNLVTHQLDRSVHLIREITVEYQFRTSLNDSGLASLQKAAGGEILKMQRSPVHRSACGQFVGLDKGVLVLAFLDLDCPGLKIVPATPVWYLLRTGGVFVALSRSPQLAGTNVDAARFASLAFQARAPTTPVQASRLFYDLKANAILMGASDVAVTRLRQNGGMVSLTDLPGAHLRVVPDYYLLDDAVKRAEYKRLLGA